MCISGHVVSISGHVLSISCFFLFVPDAFKFVGIFESVRSDNVTVRVDGVVRLLVEVKLGTVKWFNLKLFGNL